VAPGVARRGGRREEVASVWDFSGDEQLFLCIAGIASMVGTWRWYAPLVLAHGPFAWASGRASLAFLPLPALMLVYVTLQTLADPAQVAGHADYVTLFMIAGAAWVLWGAAALPLIGLESSQDLLEHRNAASLVVLAGALAGITFAYAGSNIGAGPTIWPTLVPAVLATVTLFLLHGLLELLTDTADAICIDRDVATALRTGALVAANGAILGRAMAGDWHNWRETFGTFVRLGWPAVAMTIAVAILNRRFKPTTQRPAPPMLSFGLAPATLVVGAAAAYLVAVGMPDHPRPDTSRPSIHGREVER
jgi:hypothetical protein